jgi:kinesin family protein 13
MCATNGPPPQELAGKFFSLPLVEVESPQGGVAALASWDSSIHDSVHLNRITASTERAYLIVKVAVRLSHPAAMELVLRKRICFTVVKRHSITERLKRRLGHAAPLHSVSVRYEVVSHVPAASAELEDRESLAVAAASGAELETGDGETFIERYTKGVSAVETVLLLDRLRQSVAVKERLAAGGRRDRIRKTMSVPNFVQMSQSLSFDNISGLQMRSSCSFQVQASLDFFFF